MYSFTNYTLETESENPGFRAYIEEKLEFPDSGFMKKEGETIRFDGNTFTNSEDNVRYTLDMLCEVLADIAKAFPGERFTVTGVWDTSSTAGELMDFIVRFEDRRFTVRTSGWYVEESRCLYDSYGEFVEAHGDDDGTAPLTREEFENWGEDEIMFSLDSGDGDFVREVPVVYDFDCDFTLE